MNFIAAIRARTGIDLASYKAEQMQRRLSERLEHHGAAGFSDYLRLLDRNPMLMRQLRDFLTINVSQFFRSPDRFAALRDEILPRLLAERTPLRVWSAGCSYGPEAYSLAILLQDITPGVRHRILGTDVDQGALVRAEKALDFTPRDIQYVSNPEQYFQRRGDRFELKETLRSRVNFQRGDLLAGRFERDFDLIVCRNVMIYLTPRAKERLAGGLYDALRPGGYLFTGSGEALAELPQAGFTPDAVGFYRKRECDARS